MKVNKERIFVMKTIQGRIKGVTIVTVDGLRSQLWSRIILIIYKRMWDS